MQTLPSGELFEVVGIDLLGPLPKTGRQNQHIIVLTDYGTRWVEAKAIRTANADTVAKFLLESIFLRYGAPRVMISDRGVQFMSELVQSLLSL